MDCSEISEKDKNQESIDQILYKYQQEIKHHIKIEKKITEVAAQVELAFNTLQLDHDKLKTKYKELKQNFNSITILNESLKEKNIKLEHHVKDLRAKGSTRLRDKSKGTFDNSDRLSNKKSFEFMNKNLNKFTANKLKSKSKKLNYSINKNNTKSFISPNYDYLNITKSVIIS